MENNYKAKDLTGTLFKNDKKQSDKHPDYTGSALIDGQEYQASGWLKTSNKTGDHFISLAFRLKGDATGAGSRATTNKQSEVPWN